MKIDFHTIFSENMSKDLIDRARDFGLSGLVMAGFPSENSIEYNGLRIFPAIEVDYVAVLEIPSYNSHDDWVKERKGKDLTKSYNGKLLVIMPDCRMYRKTDERLFEILNSVKKRGGVTISLHDDNNWPVPFSINDSERVYPFDAIRIRPYNMHDIHSELDFARVPVAGSGAKYLKSIKTGTAYSEYKTEISSNAELIESIKQGIKPDLKVFGEVKGEDIDIKNTVKPLVIKIPKIF